MNKTILITGATSGIGAACARKFAAAGGYNLIITGRRRERLDALKRELEEGVVSPVASPPTPASASSDPGHISGPSPAAASSPIRVWPLVFDVQDKVAVTTAIAGLPEAWKNIDLLVNNAGLALGRDFFDEANPDDWETMIDTNVKGLLYVSRAVLPLMTAAGKGHIINIGSTAGKEVYEKGNVYCASKHAVDAISKAMRIDLLRRRIRVTVIHPGAAETEFSVVRFKGDEGQAQKVYEGYIPLRAEDVADTVFYCASLPPHVCINEVVMTCTAQANSFYLYRG